MRCAASCSSSARCCPSWPQPLPPTPPWRGRRRRCRSALEDEEGGAAALRASAPFGVRYHYLAGGVNTGQSWQSWATGGGSFVLELRRRLHGERDDPGLLVLRDPPEPARRGPVRRAAGGRRQPGQPRHDARLVRGPQGVPPEGGRERHPRRAAGRARPVGLHAAPRAATTPRRVPAQVAATGMLDLRALPDTAAGVAQGVKRLRDTYAPNVRLGYQVSIWGTGKDIAVVQRGRRGGRCARHPVRALLPLAAHVVRHGLRRVRRPRLRLRRQARRPQRRRRLVGRRRLRPVRAVHRRRAREAQARPSCCGRSRSATRCTGRWTTARTTTPTTASSGCSASASREHLKPFLEAGVVALLFGSGQGDGTCACDAAGDGVTNPPPNGTATRDVAERRRRRRLLPRARERLLPGRRALPIPATTTAPARAGKRTTRIPHEAASPGPVQHPREDRTARSCARAARCASAPRCARRSRRRRSCRSRSTATAPRSSSATSTMRSCAAAGRGRSARLEGRPGRDGWRLRRQARRVRARLRRPALVERPRRRVSA